MLFNTRFDLNQLVYGIVQQSKAVTTPRCEVCDGTQRVKVFIVGHGDAEYSCPATRPDRNNHSPIVVDVNTDWVVNAPERVIKLRVQHEEVWYQDAEKFKPFHKNGVNYALTPDHYNSHKVWQEENLFDSIEQAQAACDSRNKEAS